MTTPDESGDEATSTRAAPWLTTFHPGWFGAVMGTAVVGIIAAKNPGGFSDLATTMKDLSIGAVALAALIAVLVGVTYLMRWSLHPREAWADMRDPVVGPLHATFPGGILVLAVGIASVGGQVLPVSSVPTVVEVLDAIGVPLALAVGLVFAYLLFTLDLADRRLVNGGWFIPPVVTIIVPVVLVPLLGQVQRPAARLLLFTGYAFYGIGFVLFLLVLGMLHDRLVTRELPPSGMAPSLWIVLGPTGVGAAALVELAHGTVSVLGPKAGPLELVSLVGATAIWGFGAWWLLVASSLIGRYMKHGGIAYGVGWWGFTFPLGALTLATTSLGSGWSVPVIGDLALALLVALVVVWLVVAAATLVALVSGPRRRQLSSPLPSK
jgi:C4-dicarboxylate transporter/malic acid transport protein